jgi:two-component system chemotaxis sensor kinase CheA
MEFLALAAKTELLTQNQDALAVYFLAQGAVKILINGEMVAQVETVQCFGEMSCLIPGTPASATVVTAKDSHVFKVPKDDFLQVVNQIPKLWKTLFLQMNGRFKAVNMRLSEVLEHTPQGLIKVDKKGVITNEYSIQCTEYFGKDNLSGISFAHLIHPEHPAGEALWTETFPMLFDENGTLVFSDLADLLDKEITYNLPDGSTKQFVLSYYPCRNLAGAIEAIDIGIEDVTEARELERKNAQMRAEQATLGKIYENPESFINLKKFIIQTLQASVQTFKKLQAGESDIGSDATRDYLRKLHSLKGYAGVFALKSVQEAAHHLEELIKNAQATGGLESTVMQALLDGVIELKDQYRHTEEMFNRIGESLRKRLLGVAFTQVEFARLKEAAARGDHAEIQQLTRVVERIDCAKLISGWPDESAKIATQLGREIELTHEGDGGSIPKRVFEDLDRVLIHLLRNSIDHGIEPQEERVEAGKPPTGALRVSVEADEQELRFEIQDDGRGIDFEQLADLAACNDQLDQTRVEKIVESGEIWRILFLPGFSTASEVTEVSGRGIGLSAVKTVIDSYGGTLQVESMVRQGTTFRVKVPLPKES